MEDLDRMVAGRTAELEAANQQIKRELEERAKAEEAFRIVFEESPIGNRTSVKEYGGKVQ